MKVALIGDVHANLPALETVLAHARQQGVAALWNIGDFVGYGAYPEEVVQRLRQEGAISIVGNYDLKVLKFPRKKKKWRQSKLPHKWFAFKWAYEHLSEQSRAYLSSLPKEMRLREAGWQILLTHGSPASNEEHLTPQTPIERLRELAGMAEADAIICGHSHREFARQVNDTWFVNTGSVGRPDDGDPRACYAILNLAPAVFNVTHFRLEYDLDRAIAGIRSRGLPDVFAEMLIQGRDLASVIGDEGNNH